MDVIFFLFGLLFYLRYQINQCNSESITYLSMERPAVFWYDSKYIKNVTVISKRLNRRDPRHYMELYGQVLVPLDNNIKLDIYFYQFLTNRYRPSFVELHMKLCDMINSDIIFGQTMRDALGGRACPYPPGVYDLKNLSVPYIPKGFPFTKGRIICNVSLTIDEVTKVVISGSIDMEIKLGKISKN